MKIRRHAFACKTLNTTRAGWNRNSREGMCWLALIRLTNCRQAGRLTFDPDFEPGSVDPPVRRELEGDVVGDWPVGLSCVHPAQVERARGLGSNGRIGRRTGQAWDKRKKSIICAATALRLEGKGDNYEGQSLTTLRLMIQPNQAGVLQCQKVLVAANALLDVHLHHNQLETAMIGGLWKRRGLQSYK